jgi:nitrate reductase molybdenum cofactor assembly chaperone NarJ/NarW
MADSITLLKVIALMLNYPTQDVQQHHSELVMAISNAHEIPPDMRMNLAATLDTIYQGDLLDAQENYGLLFDQGRSCSLHLFEHVHGESRDRGQAMVDLMNIYESNGFSLDAKELPDYLPLLLEYLATRPALEAREWLADVSHIIAQICAHLYERDKHYGVLLEALLIIGGAQQLLAPMKKQIAGKEPDHTLDAIDKEWEETAVTFGAPDQSCGLHSNHKPKTGGAEALHWVDNQPAAPEVNERGNAS